MSLTLVAALTWPEGVIGKNKTIPWRLSADLKRFKEMTLGHPVVMGRRTWESLAFKLPGRTNLVLSRRPMDLLTRKTEGPDLVVDSLERALGLAAQAEGGSEIFVIGGARVYAEALPKADRLALTLVHHAFAGDTLFPALDLGLWREVSRQRHTHDGKPGFDYEFLDLKRAPHQGEA